MVINSRTLADRLAHGEAIKEGLNRKRGGQSTRRSYDMLHQLWRESVLERDEFVCQMCGAKAVLAHHIVPFDQDERLRYLTANGQALCRRCHPKAHAGRPHTEEEKRRISETMKRTLAKKKKIEQGGRRHRAAR